MEILKITPKDDQLIKDVSKMALDIWTEHYAFLHTKGQTEYMLEKFQSYEVIKNQIYTGELSYYIVKMQDSYAGYFAITPKDHEMYISKLYMYKHCRGKGLARAALEFIKKEAQQQGLKEITLNVNRHNTSSVEAYKRMGFELYKESVNDIGNGFVMDDFHFKLKV